MIRRIPSLMRCTSNTVDSLSPSPSSVSAALLSTDDTTPCSGRGDCLNGTCFCEIRYSGDECTGFNLPYHAGKCVANSNLNVINLILQSTDNFALHFRSIVSILFRCCLVNYSAVDMLCGRISALKTAIAVTGLSFNNTKTFVFCGLHCRPVARRLFYDPGKFEICTIWAAGYFPQISRSS